MVSRIQAVAAVTSATQGRPPTLLMFISPFLKWPWMIMVPWSINSQCIKRSKTNVAASTIITSYFTASDCWHTLGGHLSCSQWWPRTAPQPQEPDNITFKAPIVSLTGGNPITLPWEQEPPGNVNPSSSIVLIPRDSGTTSSNSTDLVILYSCHY